MEIENAHDKPKQYRPYRSIGSGWCDEPSGGAAQAR
jgi:hypothetical protein